MSRKQISIGKWLNNNKFVAVLSVLLALVIWLVVALQMSNQMQATFNDIPVTFETTMTDSLELKMFGQTDVRVNVTVSGKRYEISPAALSSEDFIVTASTANVSSVGKYTLPISVRLKDPNKDIEIVSFMPQSVDINFDFNTSEIYPIEVQISAPNDQIAADGFIADEPLVSPAQVSITGAASEIQSISKVIAKIDLKEPLTQTTGFEKTPLVIVNANGGTVRSTYVHEEDNITDVTVTVRVLKLMQIRPTVQLKKCPNYFSENRLSYSWTPSGLINAAVETGLSDSTESLSLGSIDFSQVKPGVNTFEFACSEIANARVLDDIDTIKVSFNIDGVQSRRFTISTDNATFAELPEGIRASIPDGGTLELTVFGHADELDALTQDNFSVTVDVSTLTDAAGTVDLPAAVSINGMTSCWVFGNYTVPVVVS